MRLTAKMQTALLFCLYLTRAGKASADDIGVELNLNCATMEEILTALEEHNILVTDGHAGEFSLRGNPTVADVLKAVSKPLLTPREIFAYTLGQHEHRALALFADTLSATLNPLLNRTIRGIGNDLILAELAKMDNITETGTGN